MNELPGIPEEYREAIDIALKDHPLAEAKKGRFFGVPLSYFNRDELMQIVAWVAANSRDHRRDH